MDLALDDFVLDTGTRHTASSLEQLDGHWQQQQELVGPSLACPDSLWAKQLCMSVEQQLRSFQYNKAVQQLRSILQCSAEPAGDTATHRYFDALSRDLLQVIHNHSSPLIFKSEEAFYGQGYQILNSVIIDARLEALQWVVGLPSDCRLKILARQPSAMA